MIINNITGTNSLHSNCQADQSTAMLTNIHEFITVYQKQSIESNNVPENRSLRNLDELSLFDSQSELENLSDCEDFNSVIVFHPQSESEETEVDVIKFEDISLGSSRICQRIFKTKCEECKNNFKLMDEAAALLSIEKVLSSLNQIIPQICYEDSIRKKMIDHVQSMKTHFIGCSQHNNEIDHKIRKLAADHVILTFCNDISKILSGKTQILPDRPNLIQKLAYAERVKKKRIGKYSDIFNEQ